MGETNNEKLKRVKKITKLLYQAYPESKCSLNYKNAHELLVATILSAQCTDHRVNIVTGNLFKKYESLEDFAYCDITALSMDIHSCGYHNQKAKSIQGSSLMILEEFNRKVPHSMEDLIRLPGVGRKTANCILGEIYGIPSMVIDTHMIRIMNLLGLTKGKDAKKIEFNLMLIFNKDDWVKLTHMIIDHGRAVCIARRPKCNDCVLKALCPSITV
tara:strand:+ start:98 stop:742 length:645 start_codon:yes stop_codon:yes gene_type:complete